MTSYMYTLQHLLQTNDFESYELEVIYKKCTSWLKYRVTYKLYTLWQFECFMASDAYSTHSLLFFDNVIHIQLY